MRKPKNHINTSPETLRLVAERLGNGMDEDDPNAEVAAEAWMHMRMAAAELERLHTWDGLMELLDEHWPHDLIPTVPDGDDRDPGPRIVSLLRMLDSSHRELNDMKQATSRFVDHRLSAEQAAHDAGLTWKDSSL